MVTLQVSDNDWSLVLKYWKEVEKHLNHPDDFKEQIDFLNRIIFESAGQNTAKTKNTIKTQKAKERERDKKVDDLKQDDDDDDMKIDSKLKTFIVEPV